MKAKLILINWILSFMAACCLDLDRSSMTGILVIVAWFAGSSLLLKYADKRGWMDEIVERYKLDEL